jgi:ABC-2 type transport system ATP-binding protein
MRQKLALARCLIHEPRLLFMDEPTSGLDPESARTVRDSIRSIKKEGRTILLCTHNLDEAERLCDRIAIMNRRILEVGPPHRLKRSMDRKVIIRLERMSDRILSMLDGMDGVRNVEKEGDSLVLEVDNPESNNADIINSIVRVGGRIQFVSERGQSLEDVYLRLVGGRHVR